MILEWIVNAYQKKNIFTIKNDVNNVQYRDNIYGSSRFFQPSESARRKVRDGQENDTDLSQAERAFFAMCFPVFVLSDSRESKQLIFFSFLEG